MHARDRGHGAGGAEQVHAPRLALAAMRSGEAPHMRRDFLGHRLIDLRRDRHAAVALGERHHADRQRRPQRIRPLRVPPRLRRPSRRSSDDPPPMSNRMTPSASAIASGAQPAAAVGLGFAVDDLEIEADARDHASRNSPPLLRRTAGLRRDQPCRVTARCRILSRQTDSASTCALIAASPSRPEAAMPSPRRMMRENASTTRKPFARSDRPRDQQTAIVGAEVERRVGVAVVGLKGWTFGS